MGGKIPIGAADASTYINCMAQTWTMVLRCYGCGGKFTLAHIPREQLTSLPLVATCPHCGIRPAIGTIAEETYIHRVFDLRFDRPPAPPRRPPLGATK
jgi:DNA-directed RNA polymerase subunit RPC12/RpoP